MTQSTLATPPLVSVVTPFFNTAPYLAECIESVLAQSYSYFEYILMNNCSTDGSGEIAASYASRDPRIRLIQCSQFLPQLENYNRALAAISEASKYCKIVQADDSIFPDCLQLMVRAFEQSESIGLVGSYWLAGDELGGSGFPRQILMLPGKECGRWFLRTGLGIFGTQTQVMYRSSLVRCDEAFYNVSFPFADLLKCMEILERWDFSFVHQVLSFSRRDNEAILRHIERFQPYQLLRYTIAQRYAPVFLEAHEAASIIKKYKREYYRFLARAALRLRGRAFWQFHKKMLKALSGCEPFDWPYLTLMIVPELLWLAANPGTTTMRALRSLNREKEKQTEPDRSLPISSVGECKKVAFFGHFDSSNFGNESTLQAILYHLRRFQPDAEVICICTGPEATAATHHIETIPIAETFLNFWMPRKGLLKVIRRAFIGLPSEPYRWAKGVIRLSRTHVLIVPGTGLLTDAYGLSSWGPYNLFKWALIARICRCKLFFVSVGGGPIYGTVGRCLVKLALSLADFRSYRDNPTKQYLESMGLRVAKDPVYPDLAFSLAEAVIPPQEFKKNGRSVVGIGVMGYAGKYTVYGANDKIHSAYLETLVTVVKWLLARGHDVRLLTGDLSDRQALQAFRDLLQERLSPCAEGHIISEPICSIEELLSEIVACDVVVATRFHNIILALLCDKPVISISFHHKCQSLMSSMGLIEYCLDISDLRADQVIEKFSDLETNADKLKLLIKEKARDFRGALDEQYKYIFNDLL